VERWLLDRRGAAGLFDARLQGRRSMLTSVPVFGGNITANRATRMQRPQILLAALLRSQTSIEAFRSHGRFWAGLDRRSKIRSEGDTTLRQCSSRALVVLDRPRHRSVQGVYYLCAQTSQRHSRALSDSEKFMNSSILPSSSPYNPPKHTERMDSKHPFKQTSLGTFFLGCFFFTPLALH